MESIFFTMKTLLVRAFLQCLRIEKKITSHRIRTQIHISRFTETCWRHNCLNIQYTATVIALYVFRVGLLLF